MDHLETFVMAKMTANNVSSGKAKRIIPVMPSMRILICIFIFASLQLSSQKRYMDSLLKIYNSAQHDTIRFNAFSYYAGYFTNNKPDTAVVLLEKIIRGMEKKLDDDQTKPAERKAYSKLLATAYSNLGYIHHDYGNVQKALDYYFKCLAMDQKLNDLEGLSLDYNNIGYVYYYQNLREKALEYYNKSLEIAIKGNNGYLIAGAYNNLGATYKEEEDIDKAREYYDKALELYKQLNYKKGIGEILLNKANIMENTPENLSTILSLLNESLQLRKEIEDYKGMTDAYYSLGNSWYHVRKYESARSYADSCLKLAQKVGFVAPIKNASYLLFKISRETKHFEEALNYYTVYNTMRDSILNDQTKQSAIQNQMKQDFAIKQLSDSLKFAEESRVREVVIESERKQKYASFGLIGLMGVALIIGFVGYRKIRSSNQVISSQKTIVEEKNKEILDSINYAKRLQSAILVTPGELKTHFTESFLLYQPKDIVAGDFYFLETMKPAGKDYLTFIAAADSTGHGVPGALVSIVCANALTRCVKEFDIADPGRILDKTRSLILETFSKSDKEVKDGMDISLACIEKKVGSTKSIVKWAGANNALWYIENNELKIIAPDKQPVGKSDDQRPFTTHTLELDKGTCLYLFTDGYADQFGGRDGKKMKHQKFKEQLMTISSKSMDEQFSILSSYFNTWKGELEQVDDVCVIGLRL
jgi:tetratricopeptide (TPR) repeat protein